jgi:hypothetical protein
MTILWSGKGCSEETASTAVDKLLNEAFAAQGLAVLRDLGLADDDARVNPNVVRSHSVIRSELAARAL